MQGDAAGLAGDASGEAVVIVKGDVDAVWRLRWWHLLGALGIG